MRTLIEQALTELHGELQLKPGYELTHGPNCTITLQSAAGYKLMFIMSTDDQFWLYDLDHQHRQGSAKLLCRLGVIGCPDLVSDIQAVIDDAVERFESNG